MTRMLVGSVAVATALIASAGSALATECANADKPVDAGVQVVIGPEGVVWATPGLEKRFGKGLVDPATGEGFHGLVGFDVDGEPCPGRLGRWRGFCCSLRPPRFS